MSMFIAAAYLTSVIIFDRIMCVRMRLLCSLVGQQLKLNLIAFGEIEPLSCKSHTTFSKLKEL